MAAGSRTVNAPQVVRGHEVVRYDIDWTSDASGNVSALEGLHVKPGKVIQVEFVPGAGGVQPTDLYDMTISDANTGTDYIQGAGANLSNAVSKLSVFTLPALYDGIDELKLNISNAGAAKQGRVTLWIGA